MVEVILPSRGFPLSEKHFCNGCAGLRRPRIDAYQRANGRVSSWRWRDMGTSSGGLSLHDGGSARQDPRFNAAFRAYSMPPACKSPGALPIPQIKGGFGGRSERRRLAEGQPPVSERSPPTQTKLLRVGRLLAPGANVQIKACGLKTPAFKSRRAYSLRDVAIVSRFRQTAATVT